MKDFEKGFTVGGIVASWRGKGALAYAARCRAFTSSTVKNLLLKEKQNLLPAAR